MNNKLASRINFIFSFAILIGLYMTSMYHYLLFHSLAEIFSIFIAITVFIITWNSYQYLKNNYLIVIGISYLFIGIIDLFYTLSFKGMGIFKDYDYYANQLWVSARYFESIVLLIAFNSIRIKKKIDLYIVFVIGLIATSLILLSIFVWRIFPVCFVDGIGLTTFKIFSEYIICFILVLSISSLIRLKKYFEKSVFMYLIISMICAILSELSFTSYTSNYGITNLIGHFFKIFSFYFIYKSFIVKGLKEPFDTIFREMILAEDKLQEQNHILKNQAILDGLTGLFNHRYIYECLEAETEKWYEEKSTFVILILDIDFFKKINDSFGHVVGDVILKELSQILKEKVSENDIVGRYGGEEFLIILRNTELKEGYQIAELIRKSVEDKVFIDNIRFSISIGVGVYRGETVNELIEKADSKLYEAKKNGRNRSVM